MYPPLCKQHIQQGMFAKDVADNTQTGKNPLTIQFMYGEVSYVQMDSFTVSANVTYMVMQFTQEDVTFLQKVRLECFLCDVPWGVLHLAMVAEAINTLQEKTLGITFKGKYVQLFSKNWKNMFLKVFKLALKKN